MEQNTSLLTKKNKVKINPKDLRAKKKKFSKYSLKIKLFKINWILIKNSTTIIIKKNNNNWVHNNKIKCNQWKKVILNKKIHKSKVNLHKKRKI